MFNLTVNSTHVANTLNNTYVYNFKSGGFIVPEGSSMYNVTAWLVERC